jgi:hypothetical protein
MDLFIARVNTRIASRRKKAKVPVRAGRKRRTSHRKPQT